MVFGGIDSNYYSGQLTYIPLTSETYWQISMDRYDSIGSTHIRMLPCTQMTLSPPKAAVSLSSAVLFFLLI